LKTERNDLRMLGYNNATNAFLRTGLYPYNPFSEAWTDAIESIGQAQPHSAGANYEVFPNKDIPQLTKAESELLHEDVELDDLILHDVAIAYIRSMHILSRWREDISKAVSEGEDYDKYSHILIPSPKTEPEKIVMRMMHFRKIETNNLCPVAKEKKSKEEESAKITRQIVYSTKKWNPLW